MKRRTGLWPAFPRGDLEGARNAGALAPMQRLAAAWKQKRPDQPGVTLTLVHQPGKSATPTRAVAPGVRALAWPEFLAEL